MADGVLVRDDAARAVAVRDEPPGRAAGDAPAGSARWRCLQPGPAAVLPHEDTYAPAVEGRRALLAATGTDLEPIVLAHDPEPRSPTLTGAARAAAPTWRSRTPTACATGSGG